MTDFLIAEKGKELGCETELTQWINTVLSRVKIVYTDIDGTVLGKRGCLLVDGSNLPSAHTAQSIVAANLCKDFVVVPCTGRSVTQLIEISRLLGWDDFIGEAGAVRSYWDCSKGIRENVYETPCWPENLQSQISSDNTPLDIINSSGAMEALLATFPGQIEYHSPWNVNRKATNVLRGRIDTSQANLLFEELSIPITLIENGVIAPSAHTLIESSDPVRAYHLAPTGASKAQAIRADLNRRGLTKDEAIMIGDGMADLDCADQVAAVFMMQNSLKAPGMDVAIASTANAYVTKGAQGDGWSQTISALLGSKDFARKDSAAI